MDKQLESAKAQVFFAIVSCKRFCYPTCCCSSAYGYGISRFSFMLRIQRAMIRWLWSLISVAEFAPIFVFSFIGGTFADRWRPKRTMICCDMLSAVSVFSVLLTIHFGSWQSIYLVTFVSAVLSQFSQPVSDQAVQAACAGCT